MDYRLVIHFDCLTVLPKTGKNRDTVDRFLVGLQSGYELGGDYQAVDPKTGRSFEVSEICGFAITWWVDSPVQEVKVVDIIRTTNSESGPRD